MGDCNKQICRLCLEVAPVYECDIIEETEKHMLEVLLINMDFDISSDYPVACKRCMERLQDCFNFKSHIATFMEVDVKIDNKVFEADTKTNGNICPVDSPVCRLCTSGIEGGTFNYVTGWNDELPLIDVIGNCLPHLDLNANNQYLFCIPCQSSIKGYYEFMKSCRAIEQKIQRFCQVKGHATAARVSLADLLQFKDCHALDKPINSDIENYVNVSECLKSEDNVNIKCEELFIKDEVDNVVKANEFDQLENSDVGENGFSKPKGIKKYKPEGTGHLCPKCPYFTNKRPRSKTGMGSESDNKTCKCSLCAFITATGLSPKAHMTSHRGPTKLFGCCACPYETDLKPNLTRHFLKHVDKLEMVMHKCEKCEYETKYQDNLIKHATTHESVNKFLCEKCPYGSNIQYNVKRHMLIHSDLQQYSCDECTFSTKRNRSLLKHKLVHLKDGERKMHECKLCTYQAKGSLTLYAHMAKAHRDSSSVEMLKCLHCPYETVLKTNLLGHVRRRHNSGDKPMLKCELCLYITTEKHDMRAHSVIHQEVSFKCNRCNFRTKRKSYLQTHMYVHNPSKKLVYKCDVCEYRTRVKSSLNQHRLRHMELKDTAVYFCATCDFQTKYKHNLRLHTASCLKRRRTMEIDG